MSASFMEQNFEVGSTSEKKVKIKRLKNKVVYGTCIHVHVSYLSQFRLWG